MLNRRNLSEQVITGDVVGPTGAAAKGKDTVAKSIKNGDQSCMNNTSKKRFILPFSGSDSNEYLAS